MVALSHHNLGNAARRSSDYPEARSQYAAGLRILQDFDDRWALALLLEDVAILAGLEHRDGAAFELLGAADALREESGSARGDALEAEIAASLAPAREALGAEGADKARERGRLLDLAGAADAALECLRR